MKKYYKCNLYQIPKKEGYVITHDKGKQNVHGYGKYIFYNNPFNNNDDDTVNDCIVKKIIVTKTINPFVVEEIITGMKFPVVYTEYFNGYIFSDDNKFRSVSLINKLHTFVRVIKWKNKKYGLEEVTDKNELDNYLHIDSEKFETDLLRIWNRGEANMYNVMQEERKRKKKILKKYL